MEQEKENIVKKSIYVVMLCVLFGISAFAQPIPGPDKSSTFSKALSLSGPGTQRMLDSIQTGTSQVELMATSQVNDDLIKSQLSTLWIAVTLNMITADVLGLYIPESMEEYTEFANGKEAELMLGGAIMYQIPISMVYLSKILPHKLNRRANMIAAGLMTAAVIGGGSTDAEYLVCAGAEVVMMALIFKKALKWSDPETKYNKTKHDLGLNLNADKKTYGLTYTYKF